MEAKDVANNEEDGAGLRVSTLVKPNNFVVDTILLICKG
jgi:hypothetical protein